MNGQNYDDRNGGYADPPDGGSLAPSSSSMRNGSRPQYGRGGGRARGRDPRSRGPGHSTLDDHLSRNVGREKPSFLDDASGFYSTCSSKHVKATDDYQSNHGRRPKAKNSDAEAADGYGDNGSRVKFARQTLGGARSSGGADASSLMDGTVGTAGSISEGPVNLDAFSTFSFFSADPSQYSLPSGLQSLHPDRMRRPKKREFILTVVVFLVLGSMARHWWSGGAAVRARRAEMADPTRQRPVAKSEGAPQMPRLMEMMLNPNVDGITMETGGGGGNESAGGGGKEGGGGSAIKDLESELSELERLLKGKKEREGGR